MMQPVKPRALLIPFSIILIAFAVCFLLSVALPPKPHVILIGLDGVSPELLGYLTTTGKLPNISLLAECGVFDKLATHKFSQTRLVWPIIYSGFSPEHNGISVESAADWVKYALTPEMRKVPAIWEDVANAGGWAMVIVPYESYPAEQENHVMEVSDIILPIPDATGEPFDAYSSDRVREWSVPRVQWGLYDPWVQNSLDFVLKPVGFNHTFSSKANYDRDVFGTMLRDLTEKMRRELLSKTVLAQSGTLLDCDLTIVYFQGTDLIQHMYNDASPLRVNTLGSENVETAMRIYDAAIGRMMDAAPAGTTFCIVSDHGFDMDPTDHAIFQIKQYGGKSTLQSTIDKAQRATINGKRMFTDIDLVNDFLSVCLSDELTRNEKQSAINFLRQEPNLFPVGLGFADDHSSGIDLQLPDKYVDDAVPPVGIFLLSGPGTKQNKRLGVISIYDVAPTLLYALNLDVAAEMDGKVKLCGFKSNWVSRNPVKMIARFPPRKKVQNKTMQDNSRRLLELQGLGYTDIK